MGHLPIRHRRFAWVASRGGLVLPARIAAALVATTVFLWAYPAAAETRALIVAGLGGDPDYEEEFQRHAASLDEHLGTVSDDVTLLTGAAATAEAVHTALTALAGRASGGDTLLFAYVGHGSWDGEQFRFNVPGVDFTALTLGTWLDAVGSGNQILIVTGASSGAVQDQLAAHGRTLITGTRSGEQRNATVFGRYFTAALTDDAADTDKDRRITVLEAFRYAEAGVERHYSRAGEMTVEHPVTSGPEPVLVLARLEEAPTLAPGDEDLIARRDALERDIANLKSRRDDYTTEAYFAELQALLLEMAMIEAELTEKEGGP